MFIYNIYGLIIESDIALKELTEENYFNRIDVTISHGIVPKDMEYKVYNSINVKFSRSEFYFYVEGVAHYYVMNGSRIIVELEKKCKPETANVFLLGTCFGMLLAQRKTIAIHGGAVILDGNGIIITGKTGTGKSTLTAAFRKEGYSILADDVSTLGKNFNGNTIIYPAYPQQKLCKDAIEKMGDDLNDYTLLDEKREKYSITLNNNFSHNSVILKSIYEINIVDNEFVGIKQLFGDDKLKTILNNIYKIEIINCASLNPKYFKKCVKTANNIAVFQINRPKDKFSVNDQLKIVKESLNLKTNSVE